MLRARRLAENYGPILPTMRAMREAGQPLSAIAAWLNREGYRTTQNSEFTRATVLRALARAKATSSSSQIAQTA